MARNKARPGRTVTVFFIGLAVCYGLVALIGTWKPALGLDLEGGTQIVLTAKGNVSKDNLNEAAGIIDSRVNGSGVSEATVTTQGGNQVVVQVPGATQDNLVQIVERQAQLRFRLVAQVPMFDQREGQPHLRLLDDANRLEPKHGPIPIAITWDSGGVHENPVAGLLQASSKRLNGHLDTMNGREITVGEESDSHSGRHLA